MKTFIIKFKMNPELRILLTREKSIIKTEFFYIYNFKNYRTNSIYGMIVIEFCIKIIKFYES